MKSSGVNSWNVPANSNANPEHGRAPSQALWRTSFGASAAPVNQLKTFTSNPTGAVPKGPSRIAYRDPGLSVVNFATGNQKYGDHPTPTLPTSWGASKDLMKDFNQPMPKPLPRATEHEFPSPPPELSASLARMNLSHAPNLSVPHYTASGVAQLELDRNTPEKDPRHICLGPEDTRTELAKLQTLAREAEERELAAKETALTIEKDLVQARADSKRISDELSMFRIASEKSARETALAQETSTNALARADELQKRNQEEALRQELERLKIQNATLVEHRDKEQRIASLEWKAYENRPRRAIKSLRPDGQMVTDYSETDTSVDASDNENGLNRTITANPLNDLLDPPPPTVPPIEPPLVPSLDPGISPTTETNRLAPPTSSGRGNARASGDESERKKKKRERVSTRIALENDRIRKNEVKRDRKNNRPGDSSSGASIDGDASDRDTRSPKGASMDRETVEGLLAEQHEKLIKMMQASQWAASPISIPPSAFGAALPNVIPGLPLPAEPAPVVLSSSAPASVSIPPASHSDRSGSHPKQFPRAFIKPVSLAPPHFEGDGLELFDEWYQQYESFAKGRGIEMLDHSLQVSVLTGCLGKQVANQVKTLPKAQKNTVESVVAYLKERYGVEDAVTRSKQAYATRDRRPKERICDYVDELRSLYYRSWPDVPFPVADNHVFDRAWRGQSPRLQAELRTTMAVVTASERNSAKLVQVIENLEANVGADGEPILPLAQLVLPLAQPISTARPPPRAIPPRVVTAPVPIGLPKTPDQPVVNPLPDGAIQPAAGPRDPTTSQCYNCLEVGHYSRECPKPRNNRRVFAMKQAFQVCSFCGVTGHTSEAHFSDQVDSEQLNS